MYPHINFGKAEWLVMAIARAAEAGTAAKERAISKIKEHRNRLTKSDESAKKQANAILGILAAFILIAPPVEAVLLETSQLEGGQLLVKMTNDTGTPMTVFTARMEVEFIPLSDESPDAAQFIISPIDSTELQNINKYAPVTLAPGESTYMRNIGWYFSQRIFYAQTGLTQGTPLKVSYQVDSGFDSYGVWSGAAHSKPIRINATYSHESEGK